MLFMIAKRYIIRGRVQGVGFAGLLTMKHARWGWPAGCGITLMARWKRWPWAVTSSTGIRRQTAPGAAGGARGRSNGIAGRTGGWSYNFSH